MACATPGRARHSRFSHQPYLRRQPESVSLIAAGAAIDRKGAPGGPPDAAVIGFFWWSAHEETDQRPVGCDAGIAGWVRRSPLRHPQGLLRSRVRGSGGRPRHRQGRHHFGRRQRSRTHARRIRGPGHARCRLSRPGLHVPQSRPDGSGHRRCRWRRRRPPHRQELHRRRHEFRNGRRAVPGSRHPGGGGRHQ